MAPLQQRTMVLEDISKAYKDYIKKQEGSWSSEEINEMNLKYYEIMGIIDSIISESNKLE